MTNPLISPNIRPNLQPISAPRAAAVPVKTSAATPPDGQTKTPDPALVKAVQAFEAVFARQLISSMRTASIGDDMFGNDAGEQFRDMADSRLADDMAKKGSLGLAEMMLKQFGAYND